MSAHATASELKRVTSLDDAWATQGSGPRLRAVRAAAERLRERMASGPRVVAVRTLPLATLLYPTRYAFWGAAVSPAPFVVMTHRCLLVQFLQRGELKLLLFNPSDVIAARQTPYFRRIARQFGDYLSYEVFTRRFDPVEDQLASLGLSAADVDYIAFDHFHTQDLRPLLGPAGRYPRATLLAPEAEWRSWDDLHPLQQAWFQVDGRSGVDPARVALTRGDLELGDGIWILRTPGHTVGNQTLFINTDSGVWGSSENGTSADSYSPHDSRIAGLRAACALTGVDVILNANTPEWMADQ
jgi:hypothetical protein